MNCCLSYYSCSLCIVATNRIKQAKLAGKEMLLSYVKLFVATNAEKDSQIRPDSGRGGGTSERIGILS